MPSESPDGVWSVHRTGGLLPPMGGVVRKRISRGRGWTEAAGIRVPFEVDGLNLRYRFPLVDELAPDGDDAYTGTACFMGRRLGSFRMTRAR